MLSSAALRDRRSTLEMAHRFRGTRSFFCIWVCLRRRGSICSTLEMACKFRGRRNIFCIWVCVCVARAAFGRCLKGRDVVERAARGLNLRDRRSTLEMARRCCGRRSCFLHLGVCVYVARAAFGKCLKGLDVVERAARGLNLRDRRTTLEMACKFRGRRSIFCIWLRGRGSVW